MMTNSNRIAVALIALSLVAGTASLAAAQSAAPGATPSPRKPSSVATPQRGPGEMDRFATRTGPGGLTTTPGRAQAGGTVGRSHCYDKESCKITIAGCDASGGGMNTNPDGSMTCTVYRRK